MKVVIIFLALLVLCYGQADENKKILNEECIKQLNLNGEEVLKLEELDLPPDDNADFNKFVACKSKKKGLMTDNGEILFDAIEQLLVTAADSRLSKFQLVAYKKIIETVINDCKSTPMVTDPGKNMIHIIACVYHKLDNIKKTLQ